MPGVIAAAILIFVPTTGDYVTPAQVGGSSGVMIANAIQLQFGKMNDWPMGAALALSSMAMVGLIVFFAVAALCAATKSIK
jgi:spermidine/putrescine transport system permease protein